MGAVRLSILMPPIKAGFGIPTAGVRFRTGQGPR